MEFLLVCMQFLKERKISFGSLLMRKKGYTIQEIDIRIIMIR